MTEPVISIIGTIYNQATHAERVLDVWCRQRFDYPYEIIVMDDGSTDGTREIVERVAERYPGRIRYFYFDTPHFTRNCTLLFNTAIRRIMRSEIAVLQWYDRIPGSLDSLSHLYEPHRATSNLLVTFLTRHIAGSSSREVFSEDDVDRLLSSVPWRERPETLTAVMGTPGGHCHPHTMNESACFSIRREHLLNINGYDERYYKVANYSNVELYGRLKHLGLTYRILDEYTFHQPHPANRGDIQTPIEPDSVVVRNTLIRQNWGAILPADHVPADRRAWTVVIPASLPRPAWAATLPGEIEVLADPDPNRALHAAGGRTVCYVSNPDVDLPALLPRLEDRVCEPACGCSATYGGRIETENGTIRLVPNGVAAGGVHGDVFTVPRRAAIENGLVFDPNLEPQLSLLDFSRQMAIWGGRPSTALTDGPSSAVWEDPSFGRRWDFLAGR